MTKSAKAIRREKIMSMNATAPSLIPGVRQIPFLDYTSMSQADKNKCERMIEEFRRTGQISCPTDRTYFKLMIVLREKRRILASQGNIAACTELDTLTRQLSDFFLENKMYVAKAEEVSILQGQAGSERARLQDLEDQWRTKRDILVKQRDREVKRVEEMTKASIAAYDSSVPKELPPEFTRLSADLLDLREKERHMIGSRRYDEADQLHKEFLKRQAQELVKRREEYAEYFEKNRAVLERRNERKEKGVKSDWNRKMNHFNHMMKKELVPLRAGVGYIETKLQDSRAEYIGEDDPIVADDPALTLAKTTGNQFRVTEPVMTRSIPPTTITATKRAIQRGQAVMSTRKMAAAMKRQNQSLDSNRWPR